MKPERHHSSPEDPQPRRPRLVEVKPPDAADEPLRCVWSGYPHYDRNCRSRIPASVVVKAWHREMQLKGTVEGFFYFSWRTGVWLAFGLEDGCVRGIYCPTHCSERDSRGAEPEDRASDRTDGGDRIDKDDRADTDDRIDNDDRAGTEDRPTGIALQ